MRLLRLCLPKQIAVLVLSAFLLPALAFGESAIRIGNFDVIPELGYQVDFDSNIFLADDDQNVSVEADLVHKITPSISLEYQKDGDNYIKFGYGPEIVLYTDYTENNYAAHNAFGKFAYKPSRDVYFRIDNNYINTKDPYGSINNYGLGEQTKRWNNTFNMILGYSLPGKSMLELIYKNYIQKYDDFDDKWQDTLYHEPGIKLYYKLLPKTSLFIEYRLQFCEYTEQQDSNDNNLGITADESQDFKYHKIFTGLHWDATEKINGDLKLGFGIKDYDNDLHWNGLEYIDYKTWLAETGLTYNQTPKRDFNVRLSRSIEDSSDVTTYSGYARTSAGIGISQMAGDKWKLRGSFDYTIGDYKGSSMDYNEYGTSIGMDYSIFRWLTLGLGYTYTVRDSAKDMDDYARNTFFFNIKSNFSGGFIARPGEIKRK